MYTLKLTEWNFVGKVEIYDALSNLCFDRLHPYNVMMSTEFHQLYIGEINPSEYLDCAPVQSVFAKLRNSAHALGNRKNTFYYVVSNSDWRDAKEWNSYFNPDLNPTFEAILADVSFDGHYPSVYRIDVKSGERTTIVLEFLVVPDSLQQKFALLSSHMARYDIAAMWAAIPQKLAYNFLSTMYAYCTLNTLTNQYSKEIDALKAEGNKSSAPVLALTSQDVTTYMTTAHEDGRKINAVSNLRRDQDLDLLTAKQIMEAMMVHFYPDQYAHKYEIKHTIQRIGVTGDRGVYLVYKM